MVTFHNISTLGFEPPLLNQCVTKDFTRQQQVNPSFNGLGRLNVSLFGWKKVGGEFNRLEFTRLAVLAVQPHTSAHQKKGQCLSDAFAQCPVPP